MDHLRDRLSDLEGDIADWGTVRYRLVPAGYLDSVFNETESSGQPDGEKRRRQEGQVSRLTQMRDGLECEVCGHFCETQADLIRHHNEKIQDPEEKEHLAWVVGANLPLPVIRCDVCRVRLASQGELVRHYIGHDVAEHRLQWMVDPISSDSSDSESGEHSDSSVLILDDPGTSETRTVRIRESLTPSPGPARRVVVQEARSSTPSLTSSTTSSSSEEASPPRGQRRRRYSRVAVRRRKVIEK